MDLGEFVSAAPDRSQLRDTFRRYELREPLRRLEEALGSADAAAPAPVAETSVGARLREAKIEDVGRLTNAEVAVAVRAPEAPEGALFAAESEWRFGVYQGGANVLAGACSRPEELVAAVGEPPRHRP